MIRLLDGVDAGARLTTRAPSTTGTRRAVTQMTRWWLGGLALSKATGTRNLNLTHDCVDRCSRTVPRVRRFRRAVFRFRLTESSGHSASNSSRKPATSEETLHTAERVAYSSTSSIDGQETFIAFTFSALSLILRNNLSSDSCLR